MVNIFKKNSGKQIRFVVAMNQVDKMTQDSWDRRLNLPKKEAEIAIKRRCEDIVNRLARKTNLSESNFEYYSALKCYRLTNLLTKIVSCSYAGFKFADLDPKSNWEDADEDVREFVEQEQRKKGGRTKSSQDKLFDEMRNILSEDELNSIVDKFRQESQRPPKVAVFGKAGVGKTTTINNLFNANWKTSHTLVGTSRAQERVFQLPTGLTLNVLDLPGYGRTIAEDKEYEKIYREMIPSCDLILLVLQANTRDFSDDEEMIIKISEWLKNSPKPQR